MRSLYTLLPLLASAGLASSATYWGVTDTNFLVSFNANNPAMFTNSVEITGLVGTDGMTPNSNGKILNLTARPNSSNGNFEFWGIDDNANFYTISLNGLATLVSSNFSPNSFNAGFAYDFFNDNFIFAGEDSENFSLSLAGAATANPNFTYAGGGTPAIHALTMDLSFGTAFAIDAQNDSLSTSTDPLFPGDSELTIVGGLGLDVTAFGGLLVDQDGNLIASLSTDGLSSSLYSIDAITGTASLIGALPQGLTTIAIPEPSSALIGMIGAAALLRRRRA